MNQRKATRDDVTAVLFQPIPQFQINHEKSALLLINFLDYTEFFVKTAVDKGISRDDALEALSFFNREAKKAADNAARLLRACREGGFEILHIRSEASTGRKTRLVVPSGHEAPPTYEALTPRKGEVELSETGGDVFTDTRLDYVLRNMSIDSLIICGLTADQNVMLSTTKAIDLKYKVVVVEDACATFTLEAYTAVIKWFKTFVNVKTTEEILALIK